jgi:adenylyltransferase/sulfurtransferase
VAPIVQVIAGIQGAEALKVLSGRMESLLPGLVTVDLWAGSFDVTDLRGQAPSCPACTAGRFDYADGAPASTAVLCGRDAVQIHAVPGTRVDLPGLASRLRAAGTVVANEHLVRFQANGADLVVFADGRVIVKGVSDAAQARSVYAKYVGS